MNRICSVRLASLWKKNGQFWIERTNKNIDNKRVTKLTFFKFANKQINNSEFDKNNSKKLWNRTNIFKYVFFEY